MNKKGFTLIELLAVIAIMAILMTIAVPSVIKISNNIKKNMYEKKVETILAAAKLYALDHLDDEELAECDTGFENGCNYTITVDKLHDKGYVNDITNPYPSKDEGFIDADNLKSLTLRLTLKRNKAGNVYVSKATPILNDVALEELYSPSGMFTIDFDPNTIDYNVTTSAIGGAITAKAKDSNDTVEICLNNPNTHNQCTSGTGSVTFADKISYGNTFTITVNNGKTTKTYTLNVVQNLLKNISSTATGFNLNFDPSINEYTTSTTDYGLSINATAIDSETSVSVCQNQCGSGMGSASYGNGFNGKDQLVFTISASKGALTEVYTVTVKKE